MGVFAQGMLEVCNHYHRGAISSELVQIMTHRCDGRGWVQGIKATNEINYKTFPDFFFYIPLSLHE